MLSIATSVLHVRYTASLRGASYRLHPVASGAAACEALTFRVQLEQRRARHHLVNLQNVLCAFTILMTSISVRRFSLAIEQTQTMWSKAALHRNLTNVVVLIGCCWNCNLALDFCNCDKFFIYVVSKRKACDETLPGTQICKTSVCCFVTVGIATSLWIFANW